MAKNDAQALTLRVNGEDRRVLADGGDRLLTVLRDELRLTGPKRGCNQGVCGACTVLADGKPIRACLAIAANTEDQEIVTVEGLAGDGPMTQLQRAFVEGAAMQCGFCTPGMLMALSGLFRSNQHPDEDEIRHAIAGNICRCTGYIRIIEAAKRVAEGDLE